MGNVKVFGVRVCILIFTGHGVATARHTGGSAAASCVHVSRSLVFALLSVGFYHDGFIFFLFERGFNYRDVEITVWQQIN